MSLGRHLLPSWMRRFVRDEQGVITVHSLFLFLTSCAIAASAVDVTHFFAARSQLQVASDIAAHAALFNRNRGNMSATEAKIAAISAVEYGMPEGSFGDVLDTADIVFGEWDAENEVFTADPDSKSAVLVTTNREEATGNSVASFFFRMVGVNRMDVGGASVFITYQPGCMTGGFSSDEMVNVQSNGGYYRGFCMHSNGHVSLNSNNYFEDGTVVSMPDLDDLDIPNSGLETNEGLEEALHEDFYHLHILDRIRVGAQDPLDTAILTPGDEDRPSYLTSSTVTTTSVNTNNFPVYPSSLTAGQVRRFDCGSSTSRSIVLTPPSGASEATYSNIVLMTNCQIQISGKVSLENVVLYTTNTSADSVKVNSGGGGSIGLWLGKEDACAPGGGAQIITRGGFRNSAKLTLNGGQIVALGDVNFASQATGVGASIVSGDTIDGSSNISMTGCSTGMEDNFTVPYFRAAY